eukprot:gnl/Ergobibamus_cyprinoides/1842.p1 GENE.gnl/Ergobibamus_cyprinoides/1842~~gnl/Ergobibamus_cyprinoides/1842.p1  ORF type:complete len:188 (+),score=41.09 gnl/Ergobibamus_cyprinoides/1842:84-647(+)
MLDVLLRGGSLQIDSTAVTTRGFLHDVDAAIGAFQITLDKTVELLEHHFANSISQLELATKPTLRVSHSIFTDNLPLTGSIDLSFDGSGLSATSLSGGEGTFASNALLAAVWVTAQLPLVMVDEWDVYLDSDRRQRSFAMLTAVLASQSHCQAVLISPNGVDLSAPALKGSLFLDTVRQMTLVPPKK